MQGEVILLWIYMKNEDILDTSPPGSGRVERGVSVSLPEEDREGGRWPSLHRQRLRVDRSEPGLSLRRCYLELETNLAKFESRRRPQLGPSPGWMQLDTSAFTFKSL